MSEERFQGGQKVLHAGKIYDFGYYSARMMAVGYPDKCVLCEQGETNLQDAIAVNVSDVQPVGHVYTRAQLEAAVAEKDREVQAVLDEMGRDAVHVRENGGHEDIYASLAISVARLRANQAEASNVWERVEELHCRMALSIDDPACIDGYNSLTLIAISAFGPQRWIATFDCVDGKEEWYEQLDPILFPTAFAAASPMSAIVGAIAKLEAARAQTEKG
jgi:hypothetical protein